MFDYTGLGATFFREYVGDGLTLNGETLTAQNVFSNALPSREWLGDPTLEIDETDVRPRYYIDGSTRDLVTLAVLFRARERATCEAFAVAARQTYLKEWFATLENENLVDDWSVDVSPIAPDVRSLEIGETFSVQIIVSVIEKKFNFTV